ncbi:Uncharacterised protein [Leminorella richardii]|uniref:PsbP C-terminal domain-containing protein n=1 Tax=Leminorella richardii TaxID=158841 RepID=A0A2X4U9L6_9GAMM|nr:hypothetical protein [Leminorella richardii]SQI35631.1 Uncharacterised protein [Leminorella richardii]
MNRLLSCFFSLFLIFPLFAQAENAFRIDLPSGEKLEVQAPDDWRKNEDKTPFDLQLLSGNERANSGIFYYYKSDLSESQTPAVVFQKQIEDMQSKRQNFREVEKARQETIGQKSVTYVLYKGERNDTAYYYYFTLVESSAHPDMFLVMVQVTFPSEWKINQPTLDAISASAKVLKE